jgi:hypothetical protein
MKIRMIFGAIIGGPGGTAVRKPMLNYKGTLKHLPSSHGFGDQATLENTNSSSGFYLEIGSAQGIFSGGRTCSFNTTVVFFATQGMKRLSSTFSLNAPSVLHVGNPSPFTRT